MEVANKSSKKRLKLVFVLSIGTHPWLSSSFSPSFWHGDIFKSCLLLRFQDRSKKWTKIAWFSTCIEDEKSASHISQIFCTRYLDISRFFFCSLTKVKRNFAWPSSYCFRMEKNLCTKLLFVRFQNIFFFNCRFIKKFDFFQIMQQCGRPEFYYKARGFIMPNFFCSASF